VASHAPHRYHEGKTGQYRHQPSRRLEVPGHERGDGDQRGKERWVHELGPFEQTIVTMMPTQVLGQARILALLTLEDGDLVLDPVHAEQQGQNQDRQERP
jgi:hypothetical protein